MDWFKMKTRYTKKVAPKCPQNLKKDSAKQYLSLSLTVSVTPFLPLHGDVDIVYL